MIVIIVLILEFPTGGQQTFVYTGSDAPAVLMLPSRAVGNYDFVLLFVLSIWFYRTK